MSLWKGFINLISTAVDSILNLVTQSISSATFSYLDAGGEQTILEITTSTRLFIRGIWLDLVNMTQNGTIKLYYKIDGTNYREVESIAFTVATDSDGAFISTNFPITSDFKITWTEGADEAAARSIPFEVYKDTRE